MRLLVDRCTRVFIQFYMHKIYFFPDFFFFNLNILYFSIFFSYFIELIIEIHSDGLRNYKRCRTIKNYDGLLSKLDWEELTPLKARVENIHIHIR